MMHAAYYDVIKMCVGSKRLFPEVTCNRELLTHQYDIKRVQLLAFVHCMELCPYTVLEDNYLNLQRKARFSLVPYLSSEIIDKNRQLAGMEWHGLQTVPILACGASGYCLGNIVSIISLTIYLCYREAVFIYDHSRMGPTSQMPYDRSVVDTVEFHHCKSIDTKNGV